MPNILIRNLSPETVAYWKERARRNRRSLQAELAHALETQAGVREQEGEAPDSTVSAEGRPKAELWARAEAIRQEILETNGGRLLFPDSAFIIRQDRETNYGRDEHPAWERARKLREAILRDRGGELVPSSVEFIREDRDSDHGRDHLWDELARSVRSSTSTDNSAAAS